MACEANLFVSEEILCTKCLYHLPFTDFHLDDKNETARQLWGKIEFNRAFSMLHLAKSSRVETLLHKLKYKNQPEIGVFLGKLYANKITSVTADIDLSFQSLCTELNLENEDIIKLVNLLND